MKKVEEDHEWLSLEVVVGVEIAVWLSSGTDILKNKLDHFQSYHNMILFSCLRMFLTFKIVYFICKNTTKLCWFSEQMLFHSLSCCLPWVNTSSHMVCSNISIGHWTFLSIDNSDMKMTAHVSLMKTSNKAKSTITKALVRQRRQQAPSFDVVGL